MRLAFGGLHPDRLADLYARYGTAAAVMRAIESGRVRMGEGAKAGIEVGTDVRRHELEAAGIAFLDRDDPAFPRQLADLPDSPPAVFVRGTLPRRPGVAVVGTRRCTAYGRRIAFDYGKAIAAAGWPLISGLARGIDGAAHRGTVDGDGVGVAVLGSGLDVLYPREHASLAEELLAGGGAVISEYPPEAAPLAWRFPPRNRIISGLSRAVVVVEAGVKGGALITARLALEQGVSVFAVPGDVQRESSRGCNLLIRDGAHPVLDPADLVEELTLVLGPVAGDRGRSDPRGAASADTDPVMAEVASSGEITIDDLVAALGEPIADVLVRVGSLEASGLVEFDGMRLRANGH